jgi:putative DNA primase/helicase
LGPASAADFISKQTAAGPAAVALCPRWRKFIGEICKGDLASTTFLQQWAGYCLTGDTREQVFLFLYGPGGNGKSVLMDTLGRLLGDYFVKPVADLYFAKGGTRHMQEVAMLAGARLITVSEVPPNASWDEGKLKDHTGGGKVTANFMRQNSFSFVPQFKITALGNHQPTFPGGMNAAIKRRFRMMLLDYVPVVVDRGLMEGLWAEREEILRWCLDGLTDPGRGWLSTGLIVPTAVQDATDEFIHDQDVFGLWLEARVEKQRGKRTNTSDLFNDWTEFRHANGAPAVATNPTAFSVEMVKRGFNRVRTMSVRGFDGIALKSKAKSAF